MILKADSHSDCYSLKEISYDWSVKSPNTQCGGVIIFKAANDSVFVQRALRAGAVSAEYSQSPTLGSENVIAIASQCCSFSFALQVLCW